MHKVGAVGLICLSLWGCGDSSGGSQGSDTTGSGAAGSGAASSGGGDVGGGGGAGGGGAAAPSGALCTPVNTEPAPPSPSGDLLDDGAIGEVFGAIHGFLDGRPWGSDPQADALAVHEFASKAPHVHDTGIAQDCSVWMALTDGTPITIFKDRRGFTDSDPNPLDELTGDEPLPPYGAADGEEPVYTKDQPATKYGLPESERAFVGQAHNMGPHVVPVIEAALKKRGYSVTKSSSVKLAQLRALSSAGELGVFYLNTHGLSCKNSVVNKVSYCVVTDDPIDENGRCLGTSSDCDVIRTDRQAGLVGFAVQWLDDGTNYAFYALNDSFLHTYGPSFAKNSLVFVDACESNSVALEGNSSTYGFAPQFRAALADNGAGTIVGWSKIVTKGFAEQIAGLLFDRLLGGNVVAAPSPPQRPFSFDQVWKWLNAKGPVRDPSNGSQLGYEKHAADDLILAPSIRNMIIGDPSQSMAATEKSTGTQLTLYGAFGTRAVQVKVNGAAVSPGDASTSNKLVIALPGANSSGPVQIEVATGGKVLTSNAAPLTSWRGTARWKTTYNKSFGPPGYFNELKCTALHLRGDVHPFRMEPGEAARPGKADDSGFAAAVDFKNSVSDTVCEGRVGGSSDLQAYKLVPTPGAIAMPWVENTTSAIPEFPASYYLVTGKIDTSDPNALKVAVWPANRLVTGADFVYPDPLPTMHVDGFSSTVTATAYMNKKLPMSAYSVNQSLFTLSTALGDMGEFEITLTPEPATAPTGDTEG